MLCVVDDSSPGGVDELLRCFEVEFTRLVLLVVATSLGSARKVPQEVDNGLKESVHKVCDRSGFKDLGRIGCTVGADVVVQDLVC